MKPLPPHVQRSVDAALSITGNTGQRDRLLAAALKEDFNTWTEEAKRDGLLAAQVRLNRPRIRRWVVEIKQEVDEYTRLMGEAGQALDGALRRFTDAAKSMLDQVRTSRMALSSESKSIADSLMSLAVATESCVKAVEPSYLVNMREVLDRIEAIASNPDAMALLKAMAAATNKPAL